jgi:hypothetical protein
MANVPLRAPVVLLGIPIHPVSARKLVDILVRWGAGPRLRRVYNVNVHAMNLACEDDTFRRWLGEADPGVLRRVRRQVGRAARGAHHPAPDVPTRLDRRLRRPRRGGGSIRVRSGR